MVEPILAYFRLLRFKGPEISKRYFRLFGELEYDLLSLQTECAVMALRLREVMRRMKLQPTLDDDEEREINAGAHELADHLYAQLDTLQRTIRSSREFQFDPVREREGYYLLADIATAIMGVEDGALRSRELETLTIACEAYGRLDLPTLTDLHDGVQHFLSLQRRDRLETREEQEWIGKLEELRRSHPLRYAEALRDPAAISERIETLKRRIAREEGKLERLNTIYGAVVQNSRYRN